MIEDALKKFNKYMADKWDEHIHKFPEADTSQWNSGFTVAQEIAENFLSHSVQEAKAEERERIQTEIALITARNANKQGTFTNIHIWANDIANFISTLTTKDGHDK